MIRVAVGEDSYLVQQGIAHVLEELPEIEVVAMCEMTTELDAIVASKRVDVVVTDIRMPPGQSDEGIRFAARLRETHPDIGVVVLSQYLEPGYAIRLFEGGSAGRAYLFKERVGRRGELERAIKTVAEGGSVTDPMLVEVLVRERSVARAPKLVALTPRELEVLTLVAEGASNTLISERLVLTKRSVEKHVGAIFSKLDLPEESVSSRRVQATLMYLAERGDGSPVGV